MSNGPLRRAMEPVWNRDYTTNHDDDSRAGWGKKVRGSLHREKEADRAGLPRKH